MLEKIRKVASTRIAKIVIVLPLVLAFGVWGIEDMLRGFGRGALATVGDREISVDDFQNNYRLELDAMSRRFGRRLSADQARLLGLPDRVMTRLVGAAVVDQHAADLGIRLAERDVVRDVQQDPNFQDSNGNFSRQALDGVLRQSGLSEARFIDERRRDSLRSIVTEPVLGTVVVPNSLVDLIHDYRNETRKIAYFKLGEAQLPALDDPDTTTLKAFFEQRQTDFRTPEFREITILSVRSDDLRKSMTISDEDLKAHYEADAAKYDTPEERTVEQIPFSDAATAEAARQEIVSGKDFMEVAKANGVAEGDVKLGRVKKSDLIDPAIAETAFALAKDEVSQVVEGEFATVLVRVTEIHEGKKRTLEDVKAQVRKEIENDRLGEAIQGTVDKVDDLRLAGKTPAEIADELKISFRKIAAVDRTGKGPDGKTLISGRDAQTLIQAAWDGAIGVESEIIELSGGGYAWVDLLSVTESKDAVFEEIRDKVVDAWQQSERARQFREKATELVDRIKGGETIEAVATSLGLEVATAGPFKRDATVKDLPRAAVAQAFAAPEGGATSVLGDDAKSRVVLVVSEVKPAPPMTDSERDALRTTIATQRREDTLGQYLAALRDQTTVEINTALLNQTLGITEQ